LWIRARIIGVSHPTPGALKRLGDKVSIVIGAALDFGAARLP
jgi:hypothetical protein